MASSALGEDQRNHGLDDIEKKKRKENRAGRISSEASTVQLQLGFNEPYDLSASARRAAWPTVPWMVILH